MVMAYSSVLQASLIHRFNSHDNRLEIYDTQSCKMRPPPSYPKNNI